MNSKKTTTIRITDDTRKMLEELKTGLYRHPSIMWLVYRAIKNYYRATLGNRLTKG